jgi:hypothetical protein
MLANFGILHIGRPIADRAHDDLDRRRGINDDWPFSASLSARWRDDDDDAAHCLSDNR